MRAVLRAAGVYNVLWGAWAILFPGMFWDLVGMPAPSYPFLWQCIGMIVGVYGVGYWIAASNPARHWPIVLVGFLGKVFGPIGFLHAWLVLGAVPARFGVAIIFNDLLWLVPFALMLHAAWLTSERSRALGMRFESHAPAGTRDEAMQIERAMRAAGTSHRATLRDLSDRGPVLLVFLRHLGCTFCRETLSDLKGQRGTIAERGLTICLVHQVADESAAKVFARYGLDDLPRISDPGAGLHRAFGLDRAGWSQVFGFRVWLRGIRAGLIDRHGVGRLQGDGFQMPGAFVVQSGEVLRAFRHRDAADRPDYCELSSTPGLSERSPGPEEAGDDQLEEWESALRGVFTPAGKA